MYSIDHDGHLNTSYFIEVKLEVLSIDIVSNKFVIVHLPYGMNNQIMNDQI